MNRFNALLSKPPAPVSEMLGKKEALATPIWALAATMISSACRTSGRRSSNSEGRPAGTSSGHGWLYWHRAPVMGPGFCPRERLGRLYLLSVVSLRTGNLSVGLETGC